MTRKYNFAGKGPPALWMDTCTYTSGGAKRGLFEASRCMWITCDVFGAVDKVIHMSGRASDPCSRSGAGARDLRGAAGPGVVLLGACSRSGRRPVRSAADLVRVC